MKHRLTLFIAMAMGILLPILPAWGTDLTVYRWKNRLLLVFSPSASNPGFAGLDRNLAKRPLDIKDRDLVVFRIFEKGASRLDDQPLSTEDALKLRNRFKVKPGQFTVLLIGKDGGVKLTRKNRADLQEVFDLIDSMPMRQQEMRKKGKTR
jgi:hypothetical protein